MAEYRLYTLDELGRISLPEAIIADGDQQVLAKIPALCPNAKICELWKGNRLVATLSASTNPGLITPTTGQAA